MSTSVQRYFSGNEDWSFLHVLTISTREMGGNSGSDSQLSFNLVLGVGVRCVAGVYKALKLLIASNQIPIGTHCKSERYGM